MRLKDQIYELDLIYNEQPMAFVIKTMEEIDRQLGGIADKPHRHNYYTVIWSFTARGKHIIDFREYQITPDSIFFVSPGQVHQVHTEAEPTGFVVMFTPEFLLKNSINKDFISDLKLFNKSDETPPLIISKPMADKLKIFADQMFLSFNSEDEHSMEAIGAYLKLFLIECNNKCSLEFQVNPQTQEVGKSLQKNFKDLVDKNFREWHQVKDYAEKLFVSANYLNEVISLSTNYSAKEFIQNRIALEAKRMLIFTEKTIKEIGYELGFSDPSHFSKFFKSKTKQSLQEFRERYGIK